ncbi:MAG: hypothetical protein ABF806_02370 [Bifidobacterium psychraerophilum]|uniref:hypothetical protein n=1 Tax=Bifidobacterium psychraerophilum TaxID=218140 RepID=UPI0039ED4BD5
MKLDPGIAIVLAAILAALVSLVALIVTVVVSWRAEDDLRTAILALYLEKHSEDVYMVIACVLIMCECSENGQDTKKWQDRVKTAGIRIDETRRKVCYCLPGFDSGFRQLSLASDHIATLIPIPGDASDMLLRAYQVLTKRINESITVSYRSGKPPKLWRQWSVERLAMEVVQLWKDRPNR